MYVSIYVTTVNKKEAMDWKNQGGIFGRVWMKERVMGKIV